MAFSVKKLKFPRPLAVTPCTVTIQSDSINADGEQDNILSDTFRCIYDEKSRRVITRDGKEVMSSSTVIIEGDIAPGYDISSGTVRVNGSDYLILNAARLRNPDGSVNHTELELK
ncbi:MAG: hypothetical protein IJU45_00600 [Clostridia bacterium]|nr:hypothetical protein [Clostridia bacterium]